MPYPASMDSEMSSSDDEQVYFCQNASVKSFSGVIDDSGTITEQEISEFIRYSRPDLHKELKGVRIASSHLTSDSDGYAKSPSVDGTEDIYAAERDRYYYQWPPYGESRRESVAAEDSPSPARRDQHLGDLEPLVIGGRYIFTLHQHTEQDMVFCCSHPTCEYPWHVIPRGEFFGSMQDGYWNQGNHLLTEYPTTVYFCIECLQQVLEQHFASIEGQQTRAPFLDGCDKEDILDAAENIHPRLTKKELFFVYLPDGPTLEPGIGSNSVKGKRLRRQKQFEIEWILARARDNECARSMREENKIQNEPSDLRIQPLDDCEPARERYKKQGMERSDACEELQVHHAPAVDTVIPTQDNEHRMEECEELLCFCREPWDQEGGMVRCSSETCMFGWIHFHCSGLSYLPITSQDYLCKYCREGNAVLLETGTAPAILDEFCSDNSPTGSTVVPTMEDRFWGPVGSTRREIFMHWYFGPDVEAIDEESNVIRKWTAVNQMRSASTFPTDCTDSSESAGASK